MKKSMRPIEKLRKIFGGVWIYDRFNRVWMWNDQFFVYRCAKLAPRYDGDDDNFTLEYRWAHNGEPIYGMTALL